MQQQEENVLRTDKKHHY